MIKPEITQIKTNLRKLSISFKGVDIWSYIQQLSKRKFKKITFSRIVYRNIFNTKVTYT